MLTLDLADDESSWDLKSDGTYSRVVPQVGVCAQQRFEELARDRTRRRRDGDGAT
jgi:hypothetical protein